MVKALARAFRWRKLLETGVYATFAELAAAEKISESYVGRVLRLTLLAPEIVEVILAGRQPEGMTLARLMQGVPVQWGEQRRRMLEPNLYLWGDRTDCSTKPVANMADHQAAR